MAIRLSASAIACADDCRRMYWYRYIAKVRTVMQSANLSFGKAIDKAVESYLLALTLGQRVPDPVAVFKTEWDKQRNEQSLSYAATQTPEQFERMGLDLMKTFPDVWEKSGMQIALDGDGVPLLQRKLSVNLGRDITLVGVIDLMAYTPSADLALIDAKTTAVANTELFAHRADQLTDYQLLVAAHSKALGIPRVEYLGFFDFLKRKASARCEAPELVPARTPMDIHEFKQKVTWLAEDIRRGRFPRASRMTYNTPCNLCDYAGHCVHGETEGLVIPPDLQQRLTA